MDINQQSTRLQRLQATDTNRLIQVHQDVKSDYNGFVTKFQISQDEKYRTRANDAVEMLKDIERCLLSRKVPFNPANVSRI